MAFSKEDDDDDNIYIYIYIYIKTKTDQCFTVTRNTIHCGLYCAALWMHCECFHCGLHCLTGVWLGCGQGRQPGGKPPRAAAP